MMLTKFGIHTALEFARMPLEWVFAHTTKPLQEIWQELNGVSVLGLATEPKTTQASIQKFKTFTPPSVDRDFIIAQLSRNIENACIKARRYSMAARDIIFILRTQEFSHTAAEVRLVQPTSVPGPIISAALAALPQLFRPGVRYRATGVVFAGMVTDSNAQPDLFGDHVAVERMRHIFESADAIDEMYGKHAVYVASSHLAQAHAQHDGERGFLPGRKTDLLRGETPRQRLAIPMLMGKELVDAVA